MSQKLQLLAQPWWVNLLWFVPCLAFASWRRERLNVSWFQLGVAALFAIAFGLNEAAVVVYLRAAAGLLPGYHGTLADVQHMAINTYQQAQSIREFPRSLLTIELFREAATMVMLLAVSLLPARHARERAAIFVWSFALWDAAYYAGLWVTVRWPASFKELDVLFLIPQPWIAQVWFPLAISGLSAVAVLLGKKKLGPASSLGSTP